jgi:hypothetical protein
MNALSRVAARTRVIIGLLFLVFAATIVSSVIRAMDAEPDLRITFSHYGTQNEYKFAVMNIANVGNAPARFYGYTPDGPSCELVQKDSTGQWQHRIFKCGTGLQPQLLLPGEQLHTTNYISRTTTTWKLGLDYTKPGLRDRLPSRLQALLSFLPYNSGPNLKAWSPEMPPVMVEVASSQSKSWE